MTAVHEPRLQLLQLTTHLAPLLGPTLGLCALLFGELAMLDFSLCESCKAVRGLGVGGGPSMESTAPHRESGRTLAQGPATGTNLVPNTLPVWAIKSWFGIGFHCAQLSTIYGDLLYTILGGVARRAWLGPRPTAHA